MSAIIRFLAKQFASKKVANKQYIDIKPLIENYKSIRGNSKATIKLFIENNNLEYLITKKNDDRPINVNIDDFNHRSHKILVSADSITRIENFLELLENNYANELEALDEIINPVEVNNETNSDVITDSTSSNVSIDSEVSEYNIIELTDDEKFRDSEDNAVDIEVRGDRTEEGILFNASDIGKYLGMERICEIIRDTRYGYEKNTHWIRLYQYPSGITTSRRTRDSRVLKETDATPEKCIWKKDQLTLNGLLKVIFSSKAFNQNMIQLRNWVIHLVFTHQFGTTEERKTLSLELNNYKSSLNDIPGIYCVRIGKVKELRESMNISTELYPAKDFDSAYVLKFGRAEDVMNRFANHCARTGYGTYGKISLEWFVMIPKTFLVKAESNLAEFFKSSGMMFNYNDGNKDHSELIIVKSGLERKQLKEKYKELVDVFPSNINEISKQMNVMKTDFEHKLYCNELQCNNKIITSELDFERKTFEFERKIFSLEKQVLELEKQLLMCTINKQKNEQTN